MTQEEKAKAYDELKVKASRIYNKENDVLIIHTIEDLFPELKESEDERIRKNLIGYIKGVNEREVCKETLNEWVAWLEKQESEPNWCHHKVDLSNCSEEYRKAYYDGWNNCNMQHSQCKSESNDVIKCLINGMKFYYEDNEEATWGTEKFSMKVKDILSWLEKQGGQKSADKVEPKFHEGDWVVSPNGVYWHIDVIQNGRYEVTADTGQCGNWPLDTNIYRLWTIQDAKDGDILFHSDSASNGIFLFKEIRHDGKVLCYCDYDSEDHFCLGEHHTCCWVNVKILHPATKKQRDTLMKAMADAGYTFDFEKKELRKIEQKHAEWSKEDEKILNSLISSLARIGASTRTDSTSINYTFLKEIDWLKSIKDRVQPKLEWNEEDNIILSRIIADYERSNEEWFNAQNSLPHGRKITWLKSLKNRVGCEANFTTTKEWNEEDEDILNTIINHFEIDLECTENDDIIRWLKSLRPQNKWKPSEGQLECLGYAIEKAEKDWSPLTNNRIYLTLRALKEHLEKL